jgi:Ca2+-binding RTX toxin-like protein
MRAAVPLVSALAALALPATAPAATVHSTTTCLPPVKGIEQGCIVNSHFTAAPGEANFVTVTMEGGRFRIHDEGAQVEAREQCTQVDANTASCPGGTLQAALGDGDDRARGPGFAVDLGPGNDQATGVTTAVGGDGDDIILGTPDFDGLSGGAGNDELDGLGGPDDLTPGPGTDVVRGSEGDDRINAFDEGPVAGDDFAGGPGADTLAYTGATGPVEIDLATGAAGGAAANDSFAGIDNVEGGRGDDVLAGDDQPNKLAGGTGRVVIDGRGGADELDGGSLSDSIDGGDGGDRIEGAGGTDDLRGGAGDDLISQITGTGALDGGDGDDLLSTENGRLRYTCGPGTDEFDGNARTIVAADCEEMLIGIVGTGKLTLPLQVRGSSVVATVRARSGDRGSIMLTDRRTGRRAGSRRFTGRGRNAAFAVRIRLSRSALRRLRATGRLQVMLAVKDLSTDAGRTERLRTTVRA